MKVAKTYDPADYATPETVRDLVRYAAQMEAALERFADDELWGYSGYWHEWHGSDDPKISARKALSK